MPRDVPEWFGKTSYLQRPKRGRDIPWGYTLAREGKMLDPIPKQLDLLRWGLLLLHTGATYEDVSDWLTNVSERAISKEGLRKLVESERTRRNRAKALRGRYSSAEDIKDWRAQEIFQENTNYPTEDEQAFKDFGVCALPSFGRVRKHNSLVNRTTAGERAKRIRENKKFVSWLRKSGRARRWAKNRNFLSRNGIKLSMLANDN